MSLSSYRMHRIYLAATMNYGLGSNDPEELAYYNQIRKETDDMKKDPIKKGITFNWKNAEDLDKWIYILFIKPINISNHFLTRKSIILLSIK